MGGEAAMIRRAGYPLLVSGVLVFAAISAIGAPDVGLATSFLRDALATQAAAIAAVALLLWVVIGIFAAVNVITALKEVGALEGPRRRRQRAVGVLVVGVLLLGMGLVRHTGSSFSVSGGSVDEARQLVR